MTMKLQELIHLNEQGRATLQSIFDVMTDTDVEAELAWLTQITLADEPDAEFGIFEASLAMVHLVQMYEQRLRERESVPQGD